MLIKSDNLTSKISLSKNIHFTIQTHILLKVIHKWNSDHRVLQTPYNHCDTHEPTSLCMNLWDSFCSKFHTYFTLQGAKQGLAIRELQTVLRNCECNFFREIILFAFHAPFIPNPNTKKHFIGVNASITIGIPF